MVMVVPLSSDKTLAVRDLQEKRGQQKWPPKAAGRLVIQQKRKSGGVRET